MDSRDNLVYLQRFGQIVAECFLLPLVLCLPLEPCREVGEGPPHCRERVVSAACPGHLLRGPASLALKPDTFQDPAAASGAETCPWPHLLSELCYCSHSSHETRGPGNPHCWLEFHLSFLRTPHPLQGPSGTALTHHSSQLAFLRRARACVFTGSSGDSLARGGLRNTGQEA